MANWVTHLMIADKVMREFPDLDRREKSTISLYKIRKR